jgi:hypothetical protein
LIEMLGQEVRAYFDDRTSLGKSESLSPPDCWVDGEGGTLQEGESFNRITEQSGSHT